MKYKKIELMLSYNIKKEYNDCIIYNMDKKDRFIATNF